MAWLLLGINSSVFAKKMRFFWFLSLIRYICTEFWRKMTEEDKRLFRSFDEKLMRLTFLYRELKRENASLKLLLSDKESEVSQLKNCLKELEEQYANLKTVRLLSVNQRELNDTKQRIGKLVREVDKCIALLNE